MEGGGGNGTGTFIFKYHLFRKILGDLFKFFHDTMPKLDSKSFGVHQFLFSCIANRKERQIHILHILTKNDCNKWLAMFSGGLLTF